MRKFFQEEVKRGKKKNEVVVTLSKRHAKADEFAQLNVQQKMQILLERIEALEEQVATLTAASGK